jgi:hypothetical protein
MPMRIMEKVNIVVQLKEKIAQARSKNDPHVKELENLLNSVLESEKEGKSI